MMFLLAVAVGANQAVAAAPTPDEIARAIRELGDNSFEVREKASQFLWEAGRAAEEAFEQTLKTNDAEVVRRARELLDRFRWGVYPDTPKNMVDLINQYRSAARQKSDVVRDLMQLGPSGYAVLLKIATAEEEAEMRRAVFRLIRQETA